MHERGRSRLHLCARPHATIGGLMADWARRLGLSREALINSARTAVATVASLLLARSLKLPEFYWAPISTIVILLSTINPLTLAWQRFAGTALGASAGRADRDVFQFQLDSLWRGHFCLRNRVLVLAA